jgi:hypothetical protein
MNLWAIQKIKYGVFLIPLMILPIFPAKVYACACCANAGEWAENSQKISDYEFKEINSLLFSPSAKILQTDSDYNVGLSNSVDYNLSLSKNQRRWNFQFKDEQGKMGTLIITIPANAVFFKTDLYAQQGGGGGTLLYKELRLEGRVTGNGIFAKGITPDTRFHLVLQGRGNNCMTAEDFNNWNLQVFGSRSKYSFYGSVKTK